MHVESYIYPSVLMCFKLHRISFWQIMAYHYLMKEKLKFYVG